MRFAADLDRIDDHMPRRGRSQRAGGSYHVVNRAVRRAPIFESAQDYAAFKTALHEALHEVPLKLFAYSAMPNHWHLVLEPEDTDQLSRFMHWLTGTHAKRWHMFKGTNGTGPVYQGRYTPVFIETERQFVWACRYVERNALRAGLVRSAEDWRWSSLWQRLRGEPTPPLADWPCLRPSGWVQYVNEPETAEEMEALRRFHKRQPGRPRKR